MKNNMTVEKLQQKYLLPSTHPDLLAIEDILPKNGLAFDAGCSKGRNTVYLQSLGMQVRAVDISQASIDYLNNLIQKENLKNIVAEVADLENLILTRHYDFINCTMVLQLLSKQGVYAVLDKFKKNTKKGGLHLIIAPMVTPNPKKEFNFSFVPNELKNIYQGWKLHKYEEDWGRLGKCDENGERIKLLFVTMVAEKV